MIYRHRTGHFTGDEGGDGDEVEADAGDSWVNNNSNGNGDITKIVAVMLVR